MRIAMWSGPRNLSTAMMYAFGNRADCAVVDEPFYACYLDRTGLDHPMRDAVLAAQSNDPETVVQSLTGPIPEGRAHFYQKHMCHHMIEGIPRGWIAGMRNVFLIRHPARVIASYTEKHEALTLEGIGFVQQAQIFEDLSAAGQKPLVIDSHDIRADPEGALRRLCAALDLAWDPAMLRWPVGGHRSDGAWAPHWYGAVHRSTGFAGAEGPLPELVGAAAALARQALPYYRQLAAQKL
ncbi:MAG: HAD family hydrolase [Pseudooceanicola sp.]|nr:HAD family hydrolase [Pseudooceanicola sp.]